MNIDIIRAWKDDSYRQSLSEEQRSLLPANPVGEVELTETDLQFVYGSGDGGFGANNFNRLQNSFTCSIQCSLDCDIRNIHITEDRGPRGTTVAVLGVPLVTITLGTGGSTAPAAATTTSSDNSSN